MSTIVSMINSRTGSEVVPEGGLILEVDDGGSHLAALIGLPVRHTCFNVLQLPQYETPELLKKKMRSSCDFKTVFGLA